MGNRNMRNAVARMTKVVTVAEKERAEALREILAGIWNLTLGVDVSRPSAYLEPYRQARAFGNASNSNLRNATRKEVIKLLNVIKTHCAKPIREIKDELRLACPAALAQNNNDAAIAEAIEVGIKLWLMIRPAKPMDDDLTVKELVAQSFEKQRVPAAAISIKELSPDFCARNLLRKGGIDILWTSCLSDHLLMDGERQLKVFHYASLLRKYREVGSIEKDLYPTDPLEAADLLTETEETLALLFPTADHGAKASKRTRKLRDKDDVDIEAQLDMIVYRDLRHYHFWGERLMIVQHLYDRSRPRRPKQWWFDRRNRMEWATFWVAVVVFLLTLLFGVISSVTGVLQVVASFRALNQS